MLLLRWCSIYTLRSLLHPYYVHTYVQTDIHTLTAVCDSFLSRFFWAIHESTLPAIGCRNPFHAHASMLVQYYIMYARHSFLACSTIIQQQFACPIMSLLIIYFFKSANSSYKWHVYVKVPLFFQTKDRKFFFQLVESESTGIGKKIFFQYNMAKQKRLLHTIISNSVLVSVVSNTFMARNK